MDNRIQVLNLLEEGKINVDEAVKLLVALGGRFRYKVEECCKENDAPDVVSSEEEIHEDSTGDPTGEEMNENVNGGSNDEKPPEEL